MTSKDAIEFYDEELSRTFRQIQEMLVNDASNPRLDNLYLTCGAYLNQMSQASQHMKGSQKQQWKEIIGFRAETFKHLQSAVHTIEF